MLAPRHGAQGQYAVEKLAPGVFAIVRNEPHPLAPHSNNLIIVNDSDVVVVDAPFTRSATLEVLATIRGLTRNPVRYVINTHWHEDHVGGNQVYRDSFPSVVFISHEATREDLGTLGQQYRQTQIGAGAAGLDQLQRVLDSGRSLIGDGPSLQSERRALHATIGIARTYLSEADTHRVPLADVTFRDSLTIHAGARRIVLKHLGLANTRGDVVVHLPDEGVVASGDIVVAPTPFALGSHIAQWPSALAQLMALQPSTLLPGHGPVMKDVRYLESLRELLEEVQREGRDALRRSVSLDSARVTITLREWEQRFAGDDRWLAYLFQTYFVRPALGRVFAER